MRILRIISLTILFASASFAQSPAPATVIEHDGIRVPVYEGFDALAPLLEAPDSTLLIVNFWATWCVPCVEELPWFEELLEMYPRERVQLLLVNLDFRKQLKKRLLPFLAERKLAGSVVVLDDPDANAWIDRVDPNWGGAIPSTLFLGPDIRRFHEQSFTRDELHTLVSSYVEKLP